MKLASALLTLLSASAEVGAEEGHRITRRKRGKAAKSGKGGKGGKGGTGSKLLEGEETFESFCEIDPPSFSKPGDLKFNGKTCGKFPKVEDVVRCNSIYTGKVAISRSLGCPDLTAGDAAITLDGPNAMLDCQGNMVFYPPGSYGSTFFRGPNGIVLKNGASVTDCVVKGFDHGFDVQDGNNAIYNSRAFFNDEGVYSEGEGNLLLENSSFSFNALQGAELSHSGTLQIYGVEFTGNNEEGLEINFQFQNSSMCIYALDTDFLSNGDDSFQVSFSEVNTFKSYFGGQTRIINDDDDGFDPAKVNGTIVFADDLEVSYADDDGIEVNKFQSLTLAEGGYYYSCNNNWQNDDTYDIKFRAPPGIQFTNLAGEENLVCGDINADADDAGVVCSDDCPDDGTVVGCIVD